MGKVFQPSPPQPEYTVTAGFRGFLIVRKDLEVREGKNLSVFAADNAHSASAMAGLHLSAHIHYVNIDLVGVGDAWVVHQTAGGLFSIHLPTFAHTDRDIGHSMSLPQWSWLLSMLQEV